jgi:hypothetical protein
VIFFLKFGENEKYFVYFCIGKCRDSMHVTDRAEGVLKMT